MRGGGEAPSLAVPIHLVGVFEEICRPPTDVVVSTETLLDLIALWSDLATHPLASPVAAAARQIAAGADLPVAAAKELMSEIAEFQGQYCALNIAYFSCDDPTVGIDTVFDAVRQQWELTE